MRIILSHSKIYSIFVVLTIYERKSIENLSKHGSEVDSDVVESEFALVCTSYNTKYAYNFLV